MPPRKRRAPRKVAASVPPLPKRPPGRPQVNFHHDALTGMVVRGRRRFMKQNGILFTYSEYNQFKKRWIPEPKIVDMKVLWVEENEVKIADLEKVIAKATEELAAILATRPQ